MPTSPFSNWQNTKIASPYSPNPIQGHASGWFNASVEAPDVDVQQPGKTIADSAVSSAAQAVTEATQPVTDQPTVQAPQPAARPMPPSQARINELQQMAQTGTLGGGITELMGLWQNQSNWNADKMRMGGGNPDVQRVWTPELIQFMNPTSYAGPGWNWMIPYMQNEQ